MYITELHIFYNFCLKALYSEFHSTKVQRLLKQKRTSLRSEKKQILKRKSWEEVLVGESYKCHFESNYGTSSKGITGNS